MEQSFKQAADNFLSWMERNMFSFNKASWGVYERIRIDINQRVCWVRPDCNSEFAKFLMLYTEQTGNGYRQVFDNVVNWLLRAQNKNREKANFGSFPFWLADGNISTPLGEPIWQNDNGKVLIHLTDMYQKTRDERLLLSAVDLAGFWAGLYQKYGDFYMPDDEQKRLGVNIMRNKGPCFVLWLMAGFYKLYGVTKKTVYKQIADAALKNACAFMQGDRFLTSYEVSKTEDWRPVSSENAIALNCLSVVYKIEPTAELCQTITKLLQFISRLQDDCGGIVNGLNEHAGTSLNNDRYLCDFVYTQGFAINALIEAYEATGLSQPLAMARKLGGFLVKTQCRSESEFWDGSWRGSYSIEKGAWAGRCNQNNDLDEGGMYSVYSGWAGTNAAIGLLRLLKSKGVKA